MRGILPGRPQAKLQAVAHGLWGSFQIIVLLHLAHDYTQLMCYSQAYISGNALIILDRPTHVVQTIYIDDEFELEGVAIDEASGKLATCSTKSIYIFRPYGEDEGFVKVGELGARQGQWC